LVKLTIRISRVNILNGDVATRDNAMRNRRQFLDARFGCLFQASA
jgi:hypothetical protein